MEHDISPRSRQHHAICSSDTSKRQRVQRGIQNRRV
jgi:hypothetical protein